MTLAEAIYRAACSVRLLPGQTARAWDTLSEDYRADWEQVAKAAVAFMAAEISEEVPNEKAP